MYMSVGERAPIGSPSTETIFPSSQEVLSDVPTKLERGEQDPLRLYVATHELQHALVGTNVGLIVNEISTVPEGNIGGYTSFAPTRNIAGFQVAAAASMAHGPHGDPFGFGHDAQQINYLSYFPGSLTLEEAYGKAAQILERYDMDVRERAAEIIAYMEKVPGSIIELILERARLEIQEEKRVETLLPEVEIYMEEQYGELREFTIILERLPNGEVVQTVIEVIICESCGGRDGHMPECERFTGLETIFVTDEHLKPQNDL